MAGIQFVSKHAYADQQWSLVDSADRKEAKKIAKSVNDTGTAAFSFGIAALASTVAYFALKALGIVAIAGVSVSAFLPAAAVLAGVGLALAIVSLSIHAYNKHRPVTATVDSSLLNQQTI